MNEPAANGLPGPCRLLRLLLVLICVLCPFARVDAGGGAWNKKKDDYYVKVALSSLTADKQFGLDGRPELIFTDAAFRNGEFGVTDINLYGELGITDWLTGVGSTQVKVAVREGFYRPTGLDSTASASGLGDIWLGGRVRLLPEESPYVAAVTMSVKVPTGSPLQAIPLGTGVVDYEIAAAGGTTYFPPLKSSMSAYLYTQVALGYRMRNGSASNEMNYAAEVGASMDDLLLQVMVDGVHSFADFNEVIVDPADPNTADDLVANQSFMRWGVTASYAVNRKMDVSLGYTWNTSGRNALQLSGISLGIAWKR